MIVLDTNVLSEILKPEPSDTVLRWLAAKSSWEVFTTTITLAEIFYGIEVLAHGRRRGGLSTAVEKMFAEQFGARILVFDEASSRVFAEIVASREAAGRPISQFDAMIAAIAKVHRASVGTRNVRDFEGCGVKVVNPWAE